MTVRELGDAAVQIPTRRRLDPEPVTKCRVCAGVGSQHDRRRSRGRNGRLPALTPAPQRSRPADEQRERRRHDQQQAGVTYHHCAAERRSGEQRPPVPRPGLIERAHRGVEPDRDRKHFPALGHDRVLEEDLVAAQQHDPGRQEPSPCRSRDPSGRRIQQQRSAHADQMLRQDRRVHVAGDVPDRGQDQRVPRRVEWV